MNQCHGMGLAWIGAVLTISGTQRSARPHNIYTEYFSKLGNTILGLSGWHSAMPCLVLCRLVLSCMAQNKSLPNMLVTVSNTDCNWFAQCPWAILIANVKWIFIFTENSWYVENYQNTDISIPCKTKQDEVAPRQEGVPCALIHAGSVPQAQSIS